MIAQLVTFLGNGTHPLCLHELKILFSIGSGLSVDDIPDTHKGQGQGQGQGRGQGQG